MLLFSSFLSIQSLAEAVTLSTDDHSGFLNRFVTYLNLHRGVKSVTSQVWPALLQSKISPVLREASIRLSIAETYTSQRAKIVTDHLNQLLDNADMSAENDDACRDAVSRLTPMYQASS